MATRAEPIVQLRDVVYSIGGQRVLDGISLDVAEGETFGVMGMSGSGKSTLLHCIMGLVRPESGEIRVAGRPIVGLSERAMNQTRLTMGMSFQYSALFDSMSVRENVLFGLRKHRGMSRAEKAERCARMLEVVGMAGTEERMPSELSGGMRKRIGIARALIMGPRVMLYDEPSSGLDPVMSAVIDSLIARLDTEFGTTSLIVTHEVSELFGICDRVMMLYRGKVAACGTPAQIQATEDPVVRQFVDGSATGPISV
jgi:phospholipid/cholesterol/gamma-HCH transport system ATP-binding protein